MAGISVCIHLAANSFDTEIFEANEYAGRKMNELVIDWFGFDMCLLF